jgi:SNF2 family DNA or RNA helicase
MKGEPLGIFAASKQLINLLGARLDKAKIPYGRITGDENDRQRAQAEDDFQKGNLRALLLTYAGSTSITLTRASTCCFMQRSFGAIPNLQAEDRFHRIGQTADHVLVIDCIAPGTVEETVVKPALEGEVELFEEVVRDRDLMRRLLNG